MSKVNLQGFDSRLPPVKPILRWAGGKSRIVPHLIKYLPPEFAHYREPFLGSGALYFSISPISAVLSDNNSDLISCYKYVRDFPDEIYKLLQEHLLKTCEDYYYAIRKIYNESGSSVEQAARFIYLNKTSFNGIFRVNTNGKYNVPYGHKEPPALPSLENLLSASKSLSRAKLCSQNFEAILDDPSLQKGDLVYLDPPYPPINGTAYFTHYTAERFSWEDQRRVAEVAKELNYIGCNVMISNSEQNQVRQLFDGWRFFTLPVVRWIAANGTREKVTELVIVNYPFAID